MYNVVCLVVVIGTAMITTTTTTLILQHIFHNSALMDLAQLRFRREYLLDGDARHSINRLPVAKMSDTEGGGDDIVN
jgi:hypothetical protein